MAFPLPVPAPAARTRTIAAAIACISLVGIGLSLTIPLLALELERRGVSSLMIGVQTAVQAAASVATAFVVPRLIDRTGARALVAAAILAAAATVVAFPFVEDARLWFPLRIVLGAALTVLFIVSEFWITGTAEPSRRGVIMGIYATVLSIGFATGPAILAVLGSTGLAPYLAGAALFLIGLVPGLLADPDAGRGHGEAGSTPLLAILVAGPTAVLAAFFFGAIESSAFSFLAIWGARTGLGETQAALLLTATFLGNVACQIPIGLVADRVDKRLVLIGCASAGMLGALAAPLVASMPLVLAALLFVWGGLVAGLYTVGLAHLAEHFEPARLAAANAAFVMNYSLGMLVGPPLVGAGLDLAPPHGFAYVIAGLAGAYAILVVLRYRARS